MKKISLILIFLFMVITSYAQEDTEEQVDKLDVLDQQSKNFFKTITGLEKDYLEEQITQIKSTKRAPTKNNPRGTTPDYAQKPNLSDEEYEKNVFKHQNDMAKLTSDFTRSKQLKDIKINSMYSFNGRDYVILKLAKSKSSSAKDKELSANIQGRYLKGDHILGHKIININIRTKTIKLYKKIDDDYGYIIYLSNYGISVSDLKKEPEVTKEVKIEKTFPRKIQKKRESKSQKIRRTFAKVPKKAVVKNSSNNISSCLYTVNVSKLNVRDRNNLNGKILRLLRLNDQFIIKNKKNKWLEIDTIYKKLSGDVMVVDNQNNWVQISDINLLVDDKNCL